MMAPANPVRYSPEYLHYLARASAENVALLRRHGIDTEVGRKSAARCPYCGTRDTRQHNCRNCGAP